MKKRYTMAPRITAIETTSVKSNEITSRLNAKMHIHTVPRCAGGVLLAAEMIPKTSEASHVM